MQPGRRFRPIRMSLDEAHEARGNWVGSIANAWDDGHGCHCTSIAFVAMSVKPAAAAPQLFSMFQKVMAGALGTPLTLARIAVGTVNWPSWT